MVEKMWVVCLVPTENRLFEFGLVHDAADIVVKELANCE